MSAGSTRRTRAQERPLRRCSNAFLSRCGSWPRPPGPGESRPVHASRVRQSRLWQESGSEFRRQGCLESGGVWRIGPRGAPSSGAGARPTTTRSYGIHRAPANAWMPATRGRGAIRRRGRCAEPARRLKLTLEWLRAPSSHRQPDHLRRKFGREPLSSPSPRGTPVNGHRECTLRAGPRGSSRSLPLPDVPSVHGSRGRQPDGVREIHMTPHSDAVAADADDVAAVQQPIRKRRGNHLGVRALPIARNPVGGQHHRGAPVPGVCRLEEEPHSVRGDREMADLVRDRRR